MQVDEKKASFARQPVALPLSSLNISTLLVQQSDVVSMESDAPLTSPTSPVKAPVYIAGHEHIMTIFHVKIIPDVR